MKRGFGVGTRELSFEEGLEEAMCESKMKKDFLKAVEIVRLL